MSGLNALINLFNKFVFYVKSTPVIFFYNEKVFGKHVEIPQNEHFEKWRESLGRKFIGEMFFKKFFKIKWNFFHFIKRKI